MVSSVFEQEEEGERRQKNPSLFFVDQCLQSASLLYRPEIMTACMEGIETFDGELPAVDQRG